MNLNVLKIKYLNILLLTLLIQSLPCLSQEKLISKSIYLEIGGSGGLGSLNYEKDFFSKNTFDLSWRLGCSLAPIDKNNGVGIVIPLLVHGTFGDNHHKLDIGIGQGLTVTTKGRFHVLTTTSVGYRYEFKKNPFFLRLAYTPLISYILDFQIQHWGGITVGFLINKTSN